MVTNCLETNVQGTDTVSREMWAFLDLERNPTVLCWVHSSKFKT